MILTMATRRALATIPRQKIRIHTQTPEKVKETARDLIRMPSNPQIISNEKDVNSESTKDS